MSQSNVKPFLHKDDISREELDRIQKRIVEVIDIVELLGPRDSDIANNLRTELLPDFDKLNRSLAFRKRMTGENT